MYGPFSSGNRIYFYHAQQDQFVFQDGACLQRPANIPRERLMRGLETVSTQQYTYSGSPPGNNANYVAQAQYDSPGEQSTSGDTLNTGHSSRHSGAGRPILPHGTQSQSTHYSSSPPTSNSAGYWAQAAAPPQYHPHSQANQPVYASSSASPGTYTYRRTASQPSGAPESSLVASLGNLSVVDRTRSDQGQQSDHVDTSAGAVQPQVFADVNGDRIVKAVHPHSHVTTTIKTGVPAHITDPNLYSQGIKAQRMYLGTEGEAELLFPTFKKRPQPRNFFKLGKVFLMLWVEPAGESRTMITSTQPGVTIGRYGERVHSKVRRFVVVREANDYCSALPVVTYGQQGVSKTGVVKSEHGIIFTGRKAPEPLESELPRRGERGMCLHPIRVHPDNPVDKLDPLSRIDYGKVHTVHHNVKVKSLGVVDKDHMRALLYQFTSVCIPSATRITRPSLAFRRDEDDDDDDDEDENEEDGEEDGDEDDEDDDDNDDRTT